MVSKSASDLLVLAENYLVILYFFLLQVKWDPNNSHNYNKKDRPIFVNFAWDIASLRYLSV